MASFSLSPSVNVKEIDLSTSIPAVATSIAGTCGQFAWGPVEEVSLIDTEANLVKRFGQPDNNNYKDWYSAANFLAYGKNLKVVRTVDVATAKNASDSVAGGNTPMLIKNLSDFEANDAAITTQGDSVFAKYPGAEGNDIVAKALDGHLAISTVVGTFVVGETVTGASASGTVARIEAAAIYLKDVTGTFVAAETITGGTSGATAALDTVPGAVFATWSEVGNFERAPEGTEICVAVYKAGNLVETFVADSEATAKDYQGNSTYVQNITSTASQYIWVDGVNLSLELDTAASAAITLTLAGGVDGTAPVDADYRRGFDLFLDADLIDINLLIQGGAPTLTGQYIVQSIAEVRMDCVGFVSPDEADVVNTATPETSLLALRQSGDYNFSSSYGFFDGNYKYQYDRYNDVYRWVPLNGDIAGLCARTDDVTDPWYSPGGFNRGQIKNVVKLAFNPSKAQRDDLYKNNINPISSFAGEGTVLYGDKTMQTKPSAFDRINVRRLFIVLEKAIATASKYTLFEFNDAFTRARFVQMVEPFLRDVQGRRGVYDFKVIADESNNTGEVIDRNEFVGDIYIKPARSINVINLNFVAVKTGVEFKEVIG